jgi:hypothetical protein
MTFVYVLVFVLKQGAVIELKTYNTLEGCKAAAEASFLEWNWQYGKYKISGVYQCLPKPA